MAARLTFAGLADLLRAVADEALPQLPAPQARALEVALLRADAASPSEPRAVAAGLLGALRALAGTGRCSSRSTMFSGSTRRRRTRSPSRPGGWTASPSASC
jgi:hypothetical protein